MLVSLYSEQGLLYFIYDLTSEIFKNQIAPRIYFKSAKRAARAGSVDNNLYKIMIICKTPETFYRIRVFRLMVFAFFAPSGFIIAARQDMRPELLLTTSRIQSASGNQFGKLNFNTK